VLCRGLWTDIIVSPYISFGVHCEKPNKFAEGLFEVHNKGTGVEQNRHVRTDSIRFTTHMWLPTILLFSCEQNTAEVAVYNVLSYLYEIETGKLYQMEKVRFVMPLTRVLFR
jgi:dynein assembly factor 3